MNRLYSDVMDPAQKDLLAYWVRMGRAVQSTSRCIMSSIDGTRRLTLHSIRKKRFMRSYRPDRRSRLGRTYGPNNVILSGRVDSVKSSGNSDRHRAVADVTRRRQPREVLQLSGGLTPLFYCDDVRNL